MILAIIGSRTCPPIDIMAQLKHLPTGVVSGGATGADTYAREFAQKNNLPLQEFLPDYGKYGKGAPLVRNKLIVEACDCLIAFWDGQSKGTKFTIDYAVQMGKPVKIVPFRKDGIPSGTLSLNILHNLDSNKKALECCAKLKTITSAHLEWIENYVDPELYGKYVRADVVGEFDAKALVKDIDSLFGEDCIITLTTYCNINDFLKISLISGKDYIYKYQEPNRYGIVFFNSVTEEIKTKITSFLENEGFFNITFVLGEERFAVEFDYKLLFPEDLKKDIEAEHFPKFVLCKYVEKCKDLLKTNHSIQYVAVPNTKVNVDYSGDDSSLNPNMW